MHTIIHKYTSAHIDKHECKKERRSVNKKETLEKKKRTKNTQD